MTVKFGDLIRQARRDKGVSLRQVEEDTGISNAYLSQLESNSIEEPSPHKLRVLADYYKINYTVLLEAAGYLEQKKKPSSLSTLLFTSQEISEEEAAMLTTFLAHIRKAKETNDSIIKKKSK